MRILKTGLGLCIAFAMVFSLGAGMIIPAQAEEETIIEEEINDPNTEQEQEDENVETEDTTESSESEEETNSTETEEIIEEEPVMEEKTDEINDLDQKASAVAQIGDQTYETLDEAIEEAAEGSTITLLTDAEISKGFNKTLTFTGNGKISTTKQLTSNGEGWMCFGLYDSSRVLTLDGPGISWEWVTDSGTPWLMMSLSGTLNIRNGATFTMKVDSGTNGNRNAIYMNSGSSINVDNGSHFNIYGIETTNKTGQGIQLDQSGTAKINVTNNSTFLIDGTNRGYVNSPQIYVENSTFTVQNCTSNASNGGLFTAVNSKVYYLNNAGHGLSATSIDLSQGTTLTSDNNGYYGVYSSSGFTVDGTSTLNVTHNSSEGDFAGLKLTKGVSAGHVAAGAVVNIKENYCSGLSNNGTVSFDEGVNLTIVNNYNDKGTTSNGGGIYNSGTTANLTLPSNALIYDNRADTAGDDIFNGADATLTLSQPARGEILTADRDDTNENQAITNWFYDGANPNYEGNLGEAGKTARWDINKYVKVYTYDENTAKIKEKIGLKAAYAPTTTITPVDLTLYKGGNGYENVDSTADGSTDNGFPEPGYYVTLPDAINAQIQQDGSPADLSEQGETFSFSYSFNYNEGQEIRDWQLTKYTDAEGSESTMDGKYVYSLSLKNDDRKPTLRVIDENGNIQTSDNFDISDAVYTKYTTTVGTVEGESFAPGENGQAVSDTLTANVQTETIDVDFDRTVIGTGELTIRGVTNVTDEHLTTSVQEEGTAPETNMPMATVPEGTTFYINGETGMEIQTDADPSLLYDDILPEGDDADNARRIGWLKDKANAECEQTGILEKAGITNPQYAFKYMDLVDQNNGNVVLKADQKVTVYMPYPEGVDKDTKLVVLHYKDLNREVEYEDVQQAVMNSAMEQMEVTKLEDHIVFETTSFSPFVVIWGAEETTVPGEEEKPEDEKKPEDSKEESKEESADTSAQTYAGLFISMAVSAAAMAGIATLLKKRDH